MTRFLAKFLLPLAAGLCACAAQPPAPSNPLAGSAWRFVTIDGQAPVSGRAALDFAADGLSATVGCNGMGGAWHVEGNRLIAGPLMQTEMYCEGPIWGQERVVGSLLVSGPEFTIEGDRLRLSSSGHRAELARAQPQG